MNIRRWTVTDRSGRRETVKAVMRKPHRRWDNHRMRKALIRQKGGAYER